METSRRRRKPPISRDEWAYYSGYTNRPPRRRGPLLLNLIWLLLPLAMLAALSPYIWNAGAAWYQAYRQQAAPAQTFATAPALAAPAGQQQPIAVPQVQSPQNDAQSVSAPPVAPETATDIAAAQQSQPDDYQELTKPSTRVLPTLAPEGVHTQEQTAPVSDAAANEGNKPARHKP